MKLKSKYGYYGKGSTMSVSEAARAECWDMRDDQISELRASHEKMAEMFGNLVGLLHDRGVLRDADVLRLLPAYEEA